MDVDERAGWSLDYSGKKISVYFEVADVRGTRDIIRDLDFVEEPEYGAFGFEVRIAPQQIPEVIRFLTQKNIAIYTVMPIG